MIETIKINWLLMAGHACWVLGAAIVLTLVCIAINNNQSPRKPVKILAGAVLLAIAGILILQFKIPTPRLLVSKISGLETNSIIACNKPITFTREHLFMDILNGRHKRNTTHVIENTMALFYNGYVQTPMLELPVGVYNIHVTARGTKAMDDYSVLKVEFQRLEGDYLIPRAVNFITLNPDMIKRRTRLRIKEPAKGRLKILFVNDDLEPGKRDRNVWLKDITITPLKPKGKTRQ